MSEQLPHTNLSRARAARLAIVASLALASGLSLSAGSAQIRLLGVSAQGNSVLIESSEPALDLALAHCESGAIEPKILSADAVAKPEEREPLSMSELLRAWDEDLTEEAPGLALAQKWERFVALRSELVQHLDALVTMKTPRCRRCR